jgi:DNA-binding NarL/FixJ family response regulator
LGPLGGVGYLRHRLALAAIGHAAGPGADTGTGGRILVVEDEYLVASEIEAELVAAGFEVPGLARTADEAVRLALSLRPTLVIMDIRLAGRRDGIDAALEIFRSSGIRSIFATAYGDPRTRARAEAAFPLGWLTKPYTALSLLAAVRQALYELGHAPH